MDSETATANLLKVFAKCIAVEGSEEEDKNSSKEDDDDVTIEVEDMEDKSKDSANAETLTTIAGDYNNVFDLPQSVAVNSPQIISTPLSLLADKPARVWFRRWAGNNLLPTTNAPQYHRGLT